MRSEYVFRSEYEHILASLMPQNRLALRVSLATGLRIDDVLAIKVDKLSQRMTVKEQKTGKSKRIYIPQELLETMFKTAGRFYVFEHRLDPKKHRTRQAVYKDIVRSCKLFRIDENITCHTARKIYAVEQYHKTRDLQKVQKLLNHSSEAVTMIYAMADTLTQRRISGKM